MVPILNWNPSNSSVLFFCIAWENVKFNGPTGVHHSTPAPVETLKKFESSQIHPILKITNAILLPISIASIKLDSSLEKIDKILEKKDPDFLSNSNFSLLEETKAISIPEKKAERNIVIITIVRDIFIYLS